MGEESPDSQLFGPGQMHQLARILGVAEDDVRIAALTSSLNRLGSKWRKIIRSGNFDFPIANQNEPPSRRIRWLINTVETPAKNLIEALGDEHKGYFSTWGTFDPELTEIDRSEPREALRSLLSALDDLIEDLHRQQNEKAPQNAEIRFDIVCDVVELIDQTFPKIGRSRGVYDEEIGAWIGPYPEFVEVVFAEITGGDVKSGKKLNNLLRLALKDKK